MTIVPFDIDARRSAKMKSNDKILVLRPIEGKLAKTVAGQLDARLFTGENNLHAIYSDSTGMWGMKLDNGNIPGGLREQFTTFDALLNHVKVYFKTRNVMVEKVIE